MTDLFTRHKPLLESALTALDPRAFRTSLAQVQSGMIHGGTETAEGGCVGSEPSPCGPALGISDPAAALVAATLPARNDPLARGGLSGPGTR